MSSRPLNARSRSHESTKNAKPSAAQSSKPPTVRRDPHVFNNRLKAGQTPADGSAEMMVEGLGMNTVAAVAFSKKLAPVDVTEAFAQTILTVQKITAGDRKSQEAILAAQFLALNAIFTDCVLLAQNNINKGELFDRLMRIGLRAQSLGRATAESIALMQNPPTIFAKQANVSAGPQQVNNGLTSVPVARAQQLDSQPIKLLEPGHDGERLDPGTTSAATPSHSSVATVDALDGTAKRRRQGPRVETRIQRRRTPAAARRTPHAAGVARRTR